MTTEPAEAAPTREKRGGENKKKMQPWTRAEQKREISTSAKTHKQGRRRERRSSRKATIKTTIMNNEQAIGETPNKQQLKQQNNKKQCKTKMTKMGKLKNS